MHDQIPTPALNTIPSYIQTIHDYQQQAQRHVSEDVWGYLNGGAMHEISVQNNCQQFQNIAASARAFCFCCLVRHRRS